MMRTALLAAIVLSSSTSARAQEPLEPLQAVVLVTTYADGRTVHDIVTSRERGGWTPMFPRIASWRPSDGTLPVTALDFKRVLEGAAVRVWVSVLRGAPHRTKEPVQTVLVNPGERVVVESLRHFGIEPVSFALTPLVPTALDMPRVTNRTAGLEVTDIEIVAEPAPQYRTSVKNLSRQAAMTFQVQSFSGDQPTLSGRQGLRDGRPVIEPGDTYSFLWPASSRPAPTADGWAPGSHDVIEIAGVLWEDGTIEGDRASMASALLIYLGRRIQLARVVSLMRTVAEHARAGGEITASLRAALESLAVVPDDEARAEGRARLKDLLELPNDKVEGTIQTAMQEVKTDALNELRSAPSDPVGFAHWLADIIGRYEVRLGRYTQR